jgi:Protein of unknown function (DUF2384)
MTELERFQQNVLDLASECFDSPARQDNWLNTPNEGFENIVPIELSSTLDGLDDLREMLYFEMMKKSMPNPTESSLKEPSSLMSRQGNAS